MTARNFFYGLIAGAILMAAAFTIWPAPAHAQCRDYNANNVALEFGLTGLTQNRTWGHDPASTFRIQWQTRCTYRPLGLPAGRLVIEAEHHSSVPDGPPFGGKDRNTENQINLLWRTEFKLY